MVKKTIFTIINVLLIIAVVVVSWVFAAFLKITQKNVDLVDELEISTAYADSPHTSSGVGTGGTGTTGGGGTCDGTTGGSTGGGCTD